MPPHPLITGTLAHNVLDIVHTRSSATPTVDVSQEVASCRTSTSIEHHLSFSRTEEMLAASVSSAEAEAEAEEEEEEPVLILVDPAPPPPLPPPRRCCCRASLPSTLNLEDSYVSASFVASIPGPTPNDTCLPHVEPTMVSNIRFLSIMSYVIISIVFLVVDPPATRAATRVTRVRCRSGHHADRNEEASHQHTTS